jgi:hypothetical protein
MHPSKVDRRRVRVLTDLPNVGPATAKDLVLLGITAPGQLVGRDPVDLFERLGRATGVRQDPCVLDVLLSITRFMAGDAPRVWWDYTSERKQMLRSAASPGRG